MAVLSFLFFAGVLAMAVWAMIVTIAPRLDYIAVLLAGSAATSVVVPVAQRRRVRRLSPPSYRAELGMIRAAA